MHACRSTLEDPTTSSRWLSGRTLGFRLVAALGIPVLLLLATEGMLRLLNFGYSTDFFREWRAEGGTFWAENPDFARRFFSSGLLRSAQPFMMAAEKPPDTIRIFVLGESAAMGDPDFKFGLPRMLEILLRKRFPNKRFEVINAAIVAINSHVILPIARDCVSRQGDLWVVYIGNNEMVGPFGSASIFGSRGASLTAVRAGLWLKSTRLGQLLDAGLVYARGGAGGAEWSGMEMMAGQKIAHDSDATTLVYRHFAQNLTDLLKVSSRAQVPVILCTVATNLRDCAPFATLHRRTLGSAEWAQWQRAYESGIDLQSRSQFHEALAAYEGAARLDDQYAELAYRSGQCCEALARWTEAARYFRQARDLDALQFRADDQVNTIIQEAARAYKSQGVTLVDAAKAFSENSPQGLVGSDFFYEHVHLTPEGNYLLARTIAARAVEALSLKGSGDWLSFTECSRQLGLTDWNRYDALSVIAERIQRAPFTNQLDHVRQLQQISELMDRYRPATKPAQVKRDVAELKELVSRSPKDPDLRWNLAALLSSIGDTSGAEEQWRVLMGLQPQSALPVFNLARLLEGHNQEAEAFQLYAECVRRNPGYSAARYALGTAYVKRGQLREGIEQFREVVRQKPRATEARLALAQALTQVGESSRARKELQAILKLDPNNSAAHLLLGEDAAVTRH